MGAPHVELDALHWGPDWSVRSDFAERAAQAAAQPRWVIDGNYRSLVSERVWPRATAFVWLNYSFARVFSRVLWRTLRRVCVSEPLWSDNREWIANTLFDRKSILWWVISTYARRRREYRALFARPEYARVRIVEFTQPAEADAFMRALRTDDPQLRAVS